MCVENPQKALYLLRIFYNQRQETMKRILPIIAFVTAMTSTLYGQVEMYVNGGVTDLAGTTVQVNPTGPGTIVTDIHIINNTGVSKNWVITRVRINEEPTWTDYLCWGHDTDPFGGTCYSASSMNTTSWTTPAGVGVLDGEGGILQSDITPDELQDGTVTYRYYVGEGASYDDSIDVEVSFTLNTTKLTAASMSIAPNPASHTVTLYTGGVEGASVKIVDVLGNVVYKEAFVGTTKKIDVTRFRNGVYFVMIEAPGLKAVNRKLVVRH